MSRFYSKRLLWPFSGVVQVAEFDWGRALSVDGKTWSLRYAEDEDEAARYGPLWYNPDVNCALVVAINGEQFELLDDNSDLGSDEADADCQQLLETLGTMTLPFAAADHYEYWLLDEKDERPLALLQSCVDEEEMLEPVPPPEWRGMPGTEMVVNDPQAPKDAVTSPVYYRLEKLVNDRAGSKAKAAWFERTDDDYDYFPPLMLRMDWEDEEAQRLCELYLRRLAPRLLMLAGLPQAKRLWLEQAARENPYDVERFYRLYPEEVDKTIVSAARVEARMRDAAES